MACGRFVRSVSGVGLGGGPVTEPEDAAMLATHYRRPAVRPSERAVFGLLVFAFIGGLGLLAVLEPVGHGFEPKGGGWFTPAVAGSQYKPRPQLFTLPAAACFVLGLADWYQPWRVEHLN